MVALGRFLLSAQETPPAGFVVVEAGSLPEPGADPRFVPEAHAYLVNLLPEDLIYQRPDNSEVTAAARAGLSALSARCTHLGCRLEWRPNYVWERKAGWFYCPCHFATFTKAGVRVYGPAPRDIDQVEFTRRSDGSLEIHPASIRRGREYLPVEPAAPNRTAAPRR